MSLLDTPSRIVGIDVGTKRVGLAVADPLRHFAQAEGTYAPAEALEVLQSLAQDEGIETVVVGWPLTEDGEAGEAIEMVQAYVERVERALGTVEAPGTVEVVRQDERYTSEMAKDLLRRAGVSQPGRYDKGRVDAAAAAVILQDYLNTNE
ncbi:Holliday junction resolvase [Salinibacter sp. 10B]|uniref:Holliday junction resolvase RuvX n=1 Tax=Salinibacter sp. 10B TaxID=1923971 RepID=UPI000CF3CB5B|nr:Holliday junction resolvase RuvX [Salinibacter sp. 10B]PQJ36180.1 Holliday junction resolvase [Salinibacter sp. 10B]